MVKQSFAVLTLMLVSCLSLMSPAAAQQSSVRVLAVVNDEIITDVDLAYRINLAIKIGRAHV